MRAALAVLGLLAVINLCQGYEFDMLFQTKCIQEEVSDNSEVVGSYNAFNKNSRDVEVPVDTRIEDTNGIVAYENKGQAKGDFHFTSTTEGDYKLCFTTRDYQTAQDTRIGVQWKTGAAAKDWGAVAKKDNMNVLATELQKLEETVKQIHQEMQYLRRREEEMRNINEATSTRVAWFSIGSLVICCVLAAWQLWYLKNFFVRKKLL